MFLGMFSIALVVLLFCVTIEVKQARNAEMAGWIGKYDFSEFYEPNITRVYQIQISEEDGNLIAYVEVDGFQTLIRWKATLKGNKDKISLIYVDQYSDGRGSELCAGNIIISFEKKGGKLLTKWGELTPFYTDSPEAWEETFRLVDDTAFDLPTILWYNNHQ